MAKDDRSLNPREFGQLLTAVSNLRDGQARIMERISRLEAIESEGRPPMLDRLSTVEANLAELTREVTKINGMPHANQQAIAELQRFKWKAVGVIGGAGIVGGGIGTLFMELAIRRLFLTGG
tara:strand:+ start:1174 stop:1539 length:366 start_codon:yes stop_codon:yes gene_type:complete